MATLVDRPNSELVHGSEGWRIVAELTPRGGEPVVDKQHGDSFEGTSLEDVLEELAVGRLFVVGAAGDMCVRSTIHRGFTRGYDVTLVADAHTTCDLTRWGAPPPQQVIEHTNLYWAHQTAPGRTAAVVPSTELTLTG